MAGTSIRILCVAVPAVFMAAVHILGCNRLGLTELLHLLQTYVKKNALSPCVSLQNKVLLNEMF